jgi:hypothetical protein
MTLRRANIPDESFLREVRNVDGDARPSSERQEDRMHVHRATGAPGPMAVAQGAGTVFRQDLFGAEGVEQALGEALSDMDAEAAEDFMRALGTIGQIGQVAGQTLSAAAPAMGQGAAAGSMIGPWGTLLGAGVGLATHLAQNPPGRAPQSRQAPMQRRPSPQRRRPMQQIAAPRGTTAPTTPAPSMPPPWPPNTPAAPSMTPVTPAATMPAATTPASMPTMPEPTASGVAPAALIAALQDPTVRQTIMSLLGASGAPAAPSAPQAPPATGDAAEWLVGAGAAFPIGTAR